MTQEAVGWEVSILFILPSLRSCVTRLTNQDIITKKVATVLIPEVPQVPMDCLPL
uniref:Uncharacterized protein n=1 Tax=Arundo donax TaxID=35708 RepID=A0A0A8YXB6_ARUDO